ncbi:MAG: DUF333 domain-containing protein [Patescibacteria group bacterium]
MNHRTLTTIAAMAVLLAGLGAGCSKETPKDTASTEPAQQNSLANPAAVKCNNEKLGYRMGENEFGQYGVCIFDDKSECEEWAYFRGECEKADCKKWEGCPKMLPGGK